MPDRDAYLRQRGPLRSISASVRATAAWQRITDRPSSVVLYRNGSPLAAQTVRIEAMRIPKERRDAGVVSVRDIVIFGVVNHPTIPNTNVQKGDLFTLADGQYRVIDVLILVGEIQAYTERYR